MYKISVSKCKYNDFISENVTPFTLQFSILNKIFSTIDGLICTLKAHINQTLITFPINIEVNNIKIL